MQQRDLPIIDTGDVFIFLSKDQEIHDPALLTKYQQCMSEEESDRHQRFHFEKHQHQFLVSRALLRSVLGEYLNIEPAEVSFEKNSWGKPEIPSDQNSGNVSFNLSHTEGLIALAVTKNARIGVDLERVTRDAELIKLAERYFSKHEAEALNKASDDTIREDFFSYWTLKESYIKAVGKGLAIPLDSFGFDLQAKSIGFSINEPTDEKEKQWSFWQIRALEEHFLALAINSGLEAKKEIENQVKCFAGVPMDRFNLVNLPVIRN